MVAEMEPEVAIMQSSGKHRSILHNFDKGRLIVNIIANMLYKYSKKELHNSNSFFHPY